MATLTMHRAAVKAIFNDRELEKELDAAGYQFSSANSINIGRLVPQSFVALRIRVCAVVSTAESRTGEEMNVVVPTGNFGNILAAFYAKNMGVPIAKLICASNENKVLSISSAPVRMTATGELHPDKFSIHGYPDFQQPGAPDLSYCRREFRKRMRSS